MDDETTSATRSETEQKNRDRLVALVRKHGLFIPRRDFDKWRPTVETDGTVDGFWHLGELRCIATDGLQAWFIRPDGRPWIGHIGNFRWTNEVVRYVPYIDEYGEQKFFKSVKSSGAPAPYFGVPKFYKPKRKKQARNAPVKKRLSAAERLLKELQARPPLAAGK